MTVHLALAALLVLLLAPAQPASAAEPPTVAPGTPEHAELIANPCPTFHWGATEGAEELELLLFHMGAADEEPEVALRITLPGSARGWTPPLERCLEPGGLYGWSLGAVDARGEVAWSEVRLFRIPADQDALVGLETLGRGPTKFLTGGWKSLAPKITGSCAFEDELVLTGEVVSGPEIFQACKKISAGWGFEVAPGGDVTFRTGHKVILESGFSVATGGSLVVETDTKMLSAARIRTGAWHSCGLADDGSAYCWGANFSGQLGDGTWTDRTSPVAVAGGHEFTTLAAGYAHTCGIATDGATYCWGSNGHGQLGDGTENDRTEPVAAQSSEAFVSLAAGWYHTCGITADESAYCWGYNNYGQLGDGTTVWNRLLPVAVSGGHRFVLLAGGYRHTCGVDTGGSAYCWGYNSSGQLGDGTKTDSSTPEAVSGGLLFTTVAAGSYHTCGIGTRGAAYCWGANGSGRLGDGTNESSSEPSPVAGGHLFGAVFCGRAHTCGLVADGEAYCWGENRDGQLGDGTTSDRNAPVAVSGDHSFVALATGGGNYGVEPFHQRGHTCGITATGDGYCWGLNHRGQLGDGTTSASTVPVEVAGDISFRVP